MFPRSNWRYPGALIVLACAANWAPCQVIVRTPYAIYVDSYHTYFWDAGISYQIARLKAQEVKSAKLENRRKEGELILWERANLPTAQDERERNMEEQLRHSRVTAGDEEIWSGRVLNILLADAIRIYTAGLRSGDVLLSPELLKHINVTSGKADANIGIIRNEKLPWPFLWRSLRNSKDFAEHCERIDLLVAQAVKQAKEGDADAAVLDELMEHVDALERMLVTRAKAQGDKATWTDFSYVNAKVFLRRLNEAIKVLEQPGAKRYFNGVYEAKGRTVADLVQYMKINGLQFAHVLNGSEAAYKALYVALRDYDEEGGTKTRPRR
jgi:hypothetical protein